MIATDESIRVSSSIASAYETVSPPAPPYSSEIGQAHQAQLAELGDDLVRETRLAVELLGDGRDLLARELAHRVADELLLLGEVEVHGRGGMLPGRFGSPTIKERTRWLRTCRSSSTGFAARADAEKTAGMNNSYLFDIEGAGQWLVKVEDGKVDVTDGGGEADTTIATSEETMMAVINGEQNPTTAYMTGKLKIKGDMGAAMKLQKLF